MHGAWRGRAAAAALVLAVGGLLVGCNPAPGQARLTVEGAVEADEPPGTVVCRTPGDGGETTIPSWEWNGTIDGQPAFLGISSQSGPTPDLSVFRVGGRTWVHYSPDDEGGIVTNRIDSDGTLHATATLPPATGVGDVEITAALRCPGWGHSTLTGALTGNLDGVADCDVPSGSDAYSSYSVPSSNLAGQVRGTLGFAGLSGPTVDTALLQNAGVYWGATNQAGQPPQIETSVDGEGVLTASATLRRLDGQPGTVEVDAVIRCP